jgi:hypothetical protein
MADDKKPEEKVEEVAAAAPEVIVDAPEQAQEAAPAAPTLEQSTEALKAQLDQANRAAFEAHQRAQRAEQMAVQARGGQASSDMATLNAATAMLNNELDVLEQQHAAAGAAQDHQTVAKIQRLMADKTAKKQQIETYAANFQAQMQQPQQPQFQQPQRQITNPAEELAATLQNTVPTSAAWVRRNASWVNQPGNLQKLVNAHNIAMSEHQEGSPQYISRMEGIIAGGQPQQQAAPQQQESPTSQAAQPVQQRTTAPAAAPVNRGSSGSGNQVRLTRAEADFARDVLKMTPEEYAKAKMNPRTQEQLKQSRH